MRTRAYAGRKSRSRRRKRVTCHTFRHHADSWTKGKTKSAQHPEHPNGSTLGDVGHVDDEGFLSLTDRRSFMIISGGVNIYPAEIENTLVTHGKVLDVAVIGVPHAEFGEEVKAVVQLVDRLEAGRSCKIPGAQGKVPR